MMMAFDGPGNHEVIGFTSVLQWNTWREKQDLHLETSINFSHDKLVCVPDDDDCLVY